MALLEGSERVFLRAVSRFAFSNPLLADSYDHLHKALGADYVTEALPSTRSGDLQQALDGGPNIRLLGQRVRDAVDRIYWRAVGRGGAERRRPPSRQAQGDAGLYEDAVLYYVYSAYRKLLETAIQLHLDRPEAQPSIEFWPRFREDYRRLLAVSRDAPPSDEDAASVLAGFFQIRRAMRYIPACIFGESAPTARLRAAAWQSIFTHDMRRYRNGLYRRMSDITTLVTGPSGSGKELVASAIGLSGFIPFDPRKQRFEANFKTSFRALNVTTLTPSLVESALFGHVEGAFSGAVRDQTGWLETCHAGGAVFLDELGDLNHVIQAKLLRVLETREFTRVGDTAARRFQGKIIAATNRNLAAAIREGRFREDLYYRLCADTIRTPSLRQQLADRPEDLDSLVLHFCRQLVPEDAESLGREVMQWIGHHLGDDYPWPGNVREVGQCVRNILVRKHYTPVRLCEEEGQPDALGSFLEAVERGELPVKELTRRYCTFVYCRTGSLKEAARTLGMCARAVKGKVDGQLLARIQCAAAPRG